MKNEKGVTLLALAITIILMLIIAGISINVGKGSYRTMQVQNFVAKMKIIQGKVNNIKENYKNWEPKAGDKTPNNYYSGSTEVNGGLGFLPAGSCAYTEDFVEILNELNDKFISGNLTSWQPGDENIDNYYYFGPYDLKTKLGIKDIDDMYVIINFNTGNVISKDGIIDPDNTSSKIYRQYDSPSGEQLIYEDTNLSNIKVSATIEKNYGLKKKVKIEMVKNNIDLKKDDLPTINKIYYKIYSDDETLNDTYIWEDASKLLDYQITGKTATFSIDTTNKYEFKVEDINKNEYRMAVGEFLDITLCNQPELIDGMRPIYWEENKSTGELEIKVITDIYDSKWYDYSPYSKKMANAITDDGSIWVWVPRFCYTIKSNETVDLGYVSGISKTSTDKNNILETVPEAFYQNGDITGIWIAKFQANGDANTTTKMTPGNFLTSLTTENAKINCKEFVYEKVRPYSHIMTNNERKTAIILSALWNITIEENTSNYAGGGTGSKYIDVYFGQSSTNNAYGIYDLNPADKEVTNDSDSTSIGKYRAVLVVNNK